MLLKGLVWPQSVWADPQPDILGLDQVHHYHDARQQGNEGVLLQLQCAKLVMVA